MKYYVALALASVVAALPADNLDKRQGVTAKVAPSAPAPSGCQCSFSGKFALDVVPVRTNTRIPVTATPTIANYGDGAPTGVGQVSQIFDGQIQAGLNTGAFPSATASASASASGVHAVGTSCSEKPQLTLKDGVLTDDQGRTGYIASNNQFQFDDPPQSGAIYTAGFSVCQDGTLSFGGNGTFVECASGTFYNLYDETIAHQCQEIKVYVLPDTCSGM